MRRLALLLSLLLVSPASADAIEALRSGNERLVASTTLAAPGDLLAVVVTTGDLDLDWLFDVGPGRLIRVDADAPDRLAVLEAVLAEAHPPALVVLGREQADADATATEISRSLGAFSRLDSAVATLEPGTIRVRWGTTQHVVARAKPAEVVLETALTEAQPPTLAVVATLPVPTEPASWPWTLSVFGFVVLIGGGAFLATRRPGDSTDTPLMPTADDQRLQVAVEALSVKLQAWQSSFGGSTPRATGPIRRK